MRGIVAKRLRRKANVVYSNMKPEYKKVLSARKIYKELKKQYMNGEEI